MPNQFFQFKQFTIYQDHCAMKVCTDSCLFGAWVADYLEQEKNNQQNILDIGTGTGLLALMLAQKTNAIIDAVEIEEAASIQARNNFLASPWSSRLQVYNTPIQLFKTTNPNSYDFIICNPPFFENNLKTDNKLKNLALHSEALTLSELILQIQFHLNLNGQFAILLQFDRSNYFIAEALKLGFHIQVTINVKQTPNHPFFRSMMLFGNNSTSTITKELIIKENNEYTTDFSRLLTDYYLPF
jgi:tRNA1Val (adenine37-N6)-methyltransferase